MNPALVRGQTCLVGCRLPVTPRALGGAALVGCTCPADPAAFAAWACEVAADAAGVNPASDRQTSPRAASQDRNALRMAGGLSGGRGLPDGRMDIPPGRPPQGGWRRRSNTRWAGG